MQIFITPSQYNTSAPQSETNADDNKDNKQKWQKYLDERDSSDDGFRRSRLRQRTFPLPNSTSYGRKFRQFRPGMQEGQEPEDGSEQKDNNIRYNIHKPVIGHSERG